ncbi:MAG: hypothetical protein QNJ72_28195 [Pleurocapsa sp. MO_226.B13]|nr:hypothetical protein [Pleurocapsa sp. MO_226.B13]
MARPLASDSQNGQCMGARIRFAPQALGFRHWIRRSLSPVPKAIAEQSIKKIDLKKISETKF